MKSLGDECPKCHMPLIEEDAQFAWRGHIFSGLVCVSCKSLWDKDDQFINFVEKHSGIPNDA